VLAHRLLTACSPLALCCCSGSLDEGTTKGQDVVLEIEGRSIPAYITKPDKPNGAAVILATDVFGYQLPNARLIGQRRCNQQLNASACCSCQVTKMHSYGAGPCLHHSSHSQSARDAHPTILYVPIYSWQHTSFNLTCQKTCWLTVPQIC
jgi:hypothetical protein